jgi:transposase InsO family protein
LPDRTELDQQAPLRLRTQPDQARRQHLCRNRAGPLYLATVPNLHSRKIVGWSIDDHLRTDLSLAALLVAIATQRPAAGPIRHSDRGTQGEFKGVVAIPERRRLRYVF